MRGRFAIYLVHDKWATLPYFRDLRPATIPGQRPKIVRLTATTIGIEVVALFA